MMDQEHPSTLFSKKTPKDQTTIIVLQEYYPYPHDDSQDDTGDIRLLNSLVYYQMGCDSSGVLVNKCEILWAGSVVIGDRIFDNANQLFL
jgi:hypothetical protein